jgi:uncharacterized iron-regulated protein
MINASHPMPSPAASPGPLNLRFAAELFTLAWALCLGLSGCALPPKAHEPSDPQWFERMPQADVVLLGELHDQPLHHRQRLTWIAQWAERRPVAMVMEQLDVRGQAALDEARAAPPEENESLGARARRLAQAAGFSFSGWNWIDYRPFIELALERDLPLYAGNLSRDEAMQIARGAPHRLATHAPQGWGDAQQTALLRSIAEGHCGLLPEAMLAPMALAQRARDAQMAEVALRAGRAGHLVVVLAGNGHVRRDYGLPLHLSALQPGLRVFSVGLIEDGGDAGNALYDAVWSVPALRREDPCERLRKQFAPARAG